MIFIVLFIISLFFIFVFSLITNNKNYKREKNINDYDITKIELVVNKQDKNYTEYYITNIDEKLLHNNILSFYITEEDDCKFYEIRNNKTEDVIYQYNLPGNFQFLKNIQAKNIGYKNGYFNNEIMIGFVGIPHWEREYLYKEDIFYNYGKDNKRIPKHCRSFYEIFKHEFLNENFIELNGETNYSFYLMFDLLKSKQNELKKHLLNLIKNYPEVKPYCEEEMGKIGMTCYEYKGDEYIMFKRNIYVVLKDFHNKKFILNWLCGDFFRSTGLSIYVNENGVIDAIEDKTIRLYGNEKIGCTVFPNEGVLPPYIKFGTVDGFFKFTNNIWSSEKNKECGYNGGEITVEKVISLTGSPNIVNGNFICENIGLNSLKGGPRIVHGDYNCKNNCLTSFIGVPEKIEGCFNFINNELTDEAWEWAKENIDGEFFDYKHSGNKFVKYHKELY